MRIGIDFDNTIVDYEGAFHAAAMERGLVTADLPKTKNSVRDFLNGAGRKDDFTALQGYIYGTRMDLARVYPGFREFVAAARASRHDVFIVSHKTRFPLLGPKYDMHQAARAFLAGHMLSEDHAVPRQNIFFEETKEQKINRAAVLQVDVFIDDLPEMLVMRGLPERCRRILFAPHGSDARGNFEQCRRWDEITALLFGARENVLPHEMARTLAERAGLGVPKSVESLIGGRNNRVFRVDFKSGEAAVLKSYHHDPRDPRDRLRAEWSFLNYVTARGVQNVPRPLAIDAATHSALYSFVIGERPKKVDGDLIRQAAEFAVAINRAPNEAGSLDPASEACFSLASHLETVDRRVVRLRELDPNIPHVEAAQKFVDDRLKVMWDRVKSGVIRQAAERGISRTNSVRAIVSPSDFGFHNSLINMDGEASFLDFEYAGLDDPAKLICDFFCQPELPAPIRHYAEFTERLVRPLALQDEDLWRARALLDAYRVKWVCIMLNEFSPLGARRRAFASSDESGAHAAQQLRNAEHYFELISP